jgi:hypothetical protein
LASIGAIGGEIGNPTRAVCRVTLWRVAPDRTGEGTDIGCGESPDVRATRQSPPSLTAHVAGAVVFGAVVAADPGGWYPFGPTKWLVVTVAIGCAATLALWSRERPRLPRLMVVAGLVFLGWTAIAAAFGRDPLYAWTGTPERRLGVVTWCVFALCAAIASTFDAASLARWTRWATGAGAACGAYALVELVWRAPIGIDTTSRRLGGPFGSAAYLGAALCLLLPIAVGVVTDRGERRVWRGVGAFAVASGVVALVGSGSRAAWVGLGVAAVVAVVRLRPPRSMVLTAIALTGVAIVVLAPRLDDVVERAVPADSRLDEWAMATRVIARHPLFGAGPEGYRTVVADGVSAEYERTYGRDVLPDRAHSAPLDVAVTIGLPGMVMYVAIVGAVVVAAWRALGRRDRRAAVAVGVIAYLTQQLLLFPIAELDPILWLAAGALVGVERPPVPSRRVPGALRKTGVYAAVAATIVAFVTGVLGVAADRAAGRAVGEVPAAALASAERAVELRPDVVRYRLLVAAAARATATLQGIDAAIEAADAAVDLSPNDPIARRTAADVRTERARITGDRADVTAARRAWQALVDDDPLCRACQFGLGTASALDGDRVAASAAWTAADELSRPGDTRAADALAALTDSAARDDGDD